MTNVTLAVQAFCSRSLETDLSTPQLEKLASEVVDGFEGLNLEPKVLVGIYDDMSATDFAEAVLTHRYRAAQLKEIAG